MQRGVKLDGAYVFKEARQWQLPPPGVCKCCYIFVALALWHYNRATMVAIVAVLVDCTLDKIAATKTPTIGHPENGWLDQQRTCPDGAYINMWHVTKAYHIFSGNEYIETLQGFCSDGTPLQRMGGLIGSDFSSRYESMLQNGFTGVRIGFAVIDSGHAASRFGTIQSNASVAYEEVLACPSDMLINGYGGSSGWYIDSIYFACVRQAAADITHFSCLEEEGENAKCRMQNSAALLFLWPDYLLERSMLVMCALSDEGTGESKRQHTHGGRHAMDDAQPGCI
eukprot:360719-Chlamydomonas_euryale.AAC.10